MYYMITNKYIRETKKMFKLLPYYPGLNIGWIGQF